jgi:hypothetical protein
VICPSGFFKYLEIRFELRANRRAWRHRRAALGVHRRPGEQEKQRSHGVNNRVRESGWPTRAPKGHLLPLRLACFVIAFLGEENIGRLKSRWLMPFLYAASSTSQICAA